MKNKALQFENLLTDEWRTIHNRPVDLVQFLADTFTGSDTVNVHIGTDAQINGQPNACDYAICVAVHDPKVTGHGGRVFYLRFANIQTNGLWEKLYNETMLSLQLAVEISEQFGQDVAERIVVHIDANPNVRYASSDYASTLAGMVVGYGFKHVLKPHSWVSTHAADHIVKLKHLTRPKHVA